MEIVHSDYEAEMVASLAFDAVTAFAARQTPDSETAGLMYDAICATTMLDDDQLLAEAARLDEALSQHTYEDERQDWGLLVPAMQRKLARYAKTPGTSPQTAHAHAMWSLRENLAVRTFYMQTLARPGIDAPTVLRSQTLDQAGATVRETTRSLWHRLQAVRALDPAKAA